MNLNQYISELLLHKNCVIVPNFGGFIANYKPAVIDELRQNIYPPSKQVLFNPNLVSNDGLLANYVAQKNQVNYPEALTSINDEVGRWKEEIQNGGRVEIGEVGFLYFKNGQIKFEQNQRYNTLLSAFGLSEVAFVPDDSQKELKVEKTSTVQEKANEKPEKVIQLSNLVEPVKSTEVIDTAAEDKVIKIKPKRKYLKYAAVACALPLLFYSYWIPMNTNVLETGNIKASDFNPFAPKIEKQYQSRSNQLVSFSNDVHVKTWDDLIEKISPNVKVYNYQLSEKLFIPVTLSQEVEPTMVSEELDTKEVEVEPIKNTIENGNIHLISGCFSSEQNAQTLVDELKSKGYKAHIVDKNKGLYRVSAQSFQSKQKANDFKAKLEAEGYASWLLVK